MMEISHAIPVCKENIQLRTWMALFRKNRGWKRTALCLPCAPQAEEYLCMGKQSDPVRKGTDNGGPAWGKTAQFLPVDGQTTGRTRNFSAWVFNNSWREEEKSAWVKSAFFSLSIQKSTMGGVCVEAWTDSLATPLPKQLTAITSLSYQQELLTEGGWDKTKWEDTWVFFLSLAKAWLIFPHPYLCENHAPFDLVAAIVAGRVHLINYRCIFTWWPT